MRRALIKYLQFVLTMLLLCANNDVARNYHVSYISIITIANETTFIYDSYYYSTIAINTIIATPTNMANISLMDCQIDVSSSSSGITDTVAM